MPVITIDGKKVLVPDTIENPEEYAREALKTKTKPSVFGDIGRGVAAGLVGIPQGITTLGTTVVDQIFDTDLTQKLNNYFESFKPETNSTAGHITQYLTQFGIPALGVASALSKAGTGAKLLATGAVDAAVATDDVETLSDLLFDEVDDQERLRKLNGAEAASARLMDRLGVFAETAAIVGTAPLVLKGLAKGGSEITGALGVALAPVVANRFGKSKFVSAEKAIEESSQGLMKNIMDKFTFQGALKSDDVAQIKEAAAQATIQSVKQVERDFGEVMNTVEKLGTTGTLNTRQQNELAQAIGDYYSPKTRISYKDPDKINDRSEMKRVQNQALEKIKSFEGDQINYEALGINNKDRHLSEILKRQREDINLKSEMLLGFNDELVPESLKEIIRLNDGFYTQRAFKKFTDPNFKIDDDLRANAIDELAKLITKNQGVSNTQAIKDAEQIFNDLTSGKFDLFSFENPRATAELFSGNLKLDILKGRKLDSLPAVRRALGEIGGHLEKDWKKSLANTQLLAYNTSKKISALTGRAKTFTDLKKLNDGAETYGIRPFIFKQEDLNVRGKKPGDIFVDQKGTEFKVFDDTAGDLSGMVATKRFADALLDANNTWTTSVAQSLGQPYQTFLGLKSAAQYNKTVLSPSAQIRNPFGGTIMTFAAGNMGGGSFINSINKVFSNFSKGRIKRETQKVKDLGLIEQKSSAFIGEIEDLAKFAEQSTFFGRVSNSKLIKGFRNSGFNKGAQKLYTGSDDVIRDYNFISEKNRLFRALVKHGDKDVPIISAKNKLDFNTNKINGDVLATKDGINKLASRFKNNGVKDGDIDEFLTKAASDGLITAQASKNLIGFLDQEAAQIAKNVYQNYSRTGDIIKDLAKLPIGNFAAFPSEIVRTFSNIGKRAATELASSNPELQAAGMKRAVSSLVATTAVPASLTSLGLTLTGADQEQIDAYKRSFAAPWDKTATLVPLATDENGKITQMINFSYTNPYDYLARPFNRLIAEFEEGERNEDNLVKTFSEAALFSIGELASPFTTASISSKLIFEAYTGQTETGRPLYRASDSFGTKAAKGFVHQIQGIAPPVLPFNITTDPASNLPLGISTTAKDFPTAVIASTGLLGEDKLKTARGTRIDPAETLVQGFSGLRVIRPNIERSLRYRGFETNNIIRAAANEFNRVARSTNTREAEDFVKAYIESNKGRYRGMRDLYLAIEDARELGLNELKILNELKKAKVANPELVMSGIFKPSTLQKELITEAYRSDYDKARNLLPVTEIAAKETTLVQPLTGGFKRETPVVRAPKTPTVGAQVLRQQELEKLVGGS